MQFETMSQLGDTLKGVLKISKGSVEVLRPDLLQGLLMDRLIWTAVFHERGDLRGTACWVIKMTAAQLGVSIQAPQALEQLFDGEEAFLFPTFSLRGMVYDCARVIFRTALRKSLGAFCFECLSGQRGYPAPAGYEATIVAAALREHFSGPIFIGKRPLLDIKNKKAGLRLFGDSLEEIFIRCASSESPQKKQGWTATEALLIEKRLWQLSNAKKEEYCADWAVAFAQPFEGKRLQGAQEKLQALNGRHGKTFSLRDEIAAASRAWA